MKRSASDRLRRKPRFVRVRGIHMKRLGLKWRKPRGIGSKVRWSVKGKPKRPKAGYGGDLRTKWVHPSGYREAFVSSPGDLDALDPSVHAARIRKGVGLMKRQKILDRATELRIKVLNR